MRLMFFLFHLAFTDEHDLTPPVHTRTPPHLLLEQNIQLWLTEWCLGIQRLSKPQQMLRFGKKKPQNVNSLYHRYRNGIKYIKRDAFCTMGRKGGFLMLSPPRCGFDPESQAYFNQEDLQFNVSIWWAMCYPLALQADCYENTSDLQMQRLQQSNQRESEAQYCLSSNR